MHKYVEILSNKLDNLGNRSESKWLKQVDNLNTLLESAILIIHNAKVRGTPLTTVASTIGRQAATQAGYLGTTVDYVRGGLIVIETFSDVLGIILKRIKPGSKSKAYFLKVIDYPNYEQLVAGLDLTRVSNAHMPVKFVPQDWQGMLNGEVDLIRNGSVKLQTNEMPEVYHALNRLQQIPLTVNKGILEVYEVLFNKPLGFKKKDKLVYAVNYQNLHAKSGKLNWQKSRKGRKLEGLLTLNVARAMADDTFYHYYNLDWRGRIYTCSSYLTPQGSDISKALIQHRDGKPLGEHGYKWLLVALAGCYGVDKVSMSERIGWVLQNQKMIVDCATEPLKNRQWVIADSPFCFLALAMEFKNILEYQGDTKDYICKIFVYSDGSCSGVQWMSALSRDQTVAPMVNLASASAIDTPQDLYSTIGAQIFSTVEAEAEMVKHEEEYFDTIHQEYLDMVAEEDDEKLAGYWTKERWDEFSRLAPIYWNRIQDASERRSLVKRSIMCLGYGLTRFGAGENVQDDAPEIVDGLIKPLSVWFGNLIHAECRARMPLSTGMLSYFEQCAREANDEDKPYEFVAPTGFRTVQTYYKHSTKQYEFQFNGQVIRLRINTGKKMKLNKLKQVSASSPNSIHSCDAAHMARCIAHSDFPVVAIHDAFGSLPSDHEEYYGVIREQFIRTVKDIDLPGFQQGTFDIDQVVDATYAFI